MLYDISNRFTQKLSTSAVMVDEWLMTPQKLELYQNSDKMRINASTFPVIVKPFPKSNNREKTIKPGYSVIVIINQLTIIFMSESWLIQFVYFVIISWKQ